MSISLKKVQENRVNQLINYHSKSQNGTITYSEVISLLICQGILNKSISFKTMHQMWIKAHNIPQPIIKKPSIKLSDPSQKPPAITQKSLSKDQFVYFIQELAKVLFHNNKKSFELIFSEFLVDPKEMPHDQKHRATPLDDYTKKILTQQTITQFIKYQEDVRACYNMYIWQNYQSIKTKGRLLLSPKDIQFANKRMIVNGLTLFLKQFRICPNFISIQHVEDVVRVLVPPITQKQQHFYYKKLIIDLLNASDDNPKKMKINSDNNDPGVNFLQFQLLLIRLAHDSYPKELEKKGEIIIERFFKKIGLRNNSHEQFNQNKEYLKLLSGYYKEYVNKKYVNIDIEDLENDQRQNSQKRFQFELEGKDKFAVDIVEIVKALDRVLPQLPPRPEDQKEKEKQVYDQKHPPKRINIGQQAPLQEANETKQPAKEVKKQAKLNKDQIPARVFEWAPVSPIILSSEDYLKQLQMKMQTEIPHLSSLQRGNIAIQSYPSVISEIVFPTQIPQDSEQPLKDLRSCLIDKNYVLGLESLQKAYVGWKQYCIRNSTEFSPEAELFFQYSRGSIFCSAGQYSRALNCFLNCRKFTEGGKIVFNNPDRSLPYMGLGEVFYEIEQYELSTRSYLKARQIRQSLLKLQHVQTATVFCCLGACFFMMKRNIEALGYTQISQNILSSQLGCYHERTSTAKLNLKKIRRGEFNNYPAHRILWEVFEKDQFEGGKEKKKPKAQKKK